MKLAKIVPSLAFAAALSASTATAQLSPASAQPATDTVQTFYLTGGNQSLDGNYIANALHEMLPPTARVFFVPNHNTLVVRSSPDQLLLAKKIIDDLDRPRKTYRLTYTITEMDGEKRIGTQHSALVLVSGEKTVLKQGSKIPVVTGTYNPGTSSAQSQMTYLDIGLNIDATLDESVNGVRLRTKVEQSSLAEEKSNPSVQGDPIVRQSVLEGTSILTLSKPLVLGSLDIPGTTRHMDLAVQLDPVR